MALFGVRTQNNLKVVRFVKEVLERLNSFDIKRNPFRGYIKSFKDEKDLVIVINMSPLWPNLTPLIALISLIPILFFNGIQGSNWFLIPLFFISLGFFWTPDFFYMVFKAGIKKAGYKGFIKRIKKNDLIDVLAMRR